MSHDHLIRALGQGPDDQQPSLRVLLIETTALCEKARLLHKLHPIGAVALSRALTGGLLLAALGKSERNVNVQIAGDGPLGSIFVDAEPRLAVRGYLSDNPDKPLREGGMRPSLGYGLGESGYVNVMRADTQGNYFRGTVALKTGEIDDDLGEYLASSDQTESALSLDVILNDDGSVKYAGGLLLQALPQEGFTLQPLRDKLATRILYRLFKKSPETWQADIAQALGVQFQTLSEQPVEWHCNCGENRVLAALMATGVDELSDIINKEGRVDITCDFCRTDYHFDREQLIKLRDLAVSAALSHKDAGDHDDN